MFPIERAILVCALSLGVGFAAAASSVADAVLLRPLPYGEPDTLVSVVIRDAPDDLGLLEKRAVLALSQPNGPFESIAAYHVESYAVAGSKQAALSGPAEIVRGAQVTAALFDVLRVRASAGRTFTSHDGGIRHPLPVVVSSALIARGILPGEIGSRIYVDEHEYELIGVMPADFWFPDRRTLLWTPLLTVPVPGASWRAHVVARLEEPASVSTARTLAQQLLSDGGLSRTDVQLLNYADRFRATMRRPLILVQGAAALVLLLSIVTGAWILVSSVRREEPQYAIRTALGATRERQIGYFLQRVGVVTCAVAAVAAAVACGLLRALLPVGLDPVLPPSDTVILSWRVLAISAGFAVGACGMASIPALISAWRASTSRELLLRASKWRSNGRATIAAMSLQTGVAIGLASCALWLTLLLRGLIFTNVGLDVADLHAVRLASGATNATLAASRLTELVTSLQASGVSAAAASTLPLSDGWMRTSVRYLGQEARRRFTMVRLTAVTSSYFDVLGFRPVQGRVFVDGDRAARHLVVNEAFARLFFPGGNTVGAQIEFGDYVPWTIIGVVPTVGQDTLNESEKPEAYLLFDVLHTQSDDRAAHLTRQPYLLARATRPDALAAFERDARAAFPEAHVGTLRPFTEFVVNAAGPLSLVTRIAVLCALAALILLTGSVAGMWEARRLARARETCLKQALGATPWRLAREHAVEAAVLLTGAVCVSALVLVLLTPLFDDFSFISSRLAAPSTSVVLAWAVLLAGAIVLVTSVRTVAHYFVRDFARALRPE